jgi:hypothetical protein
MDEAPDQVDPDLLNHKIPASFMGSRAWASDNFVDGLAIARDLGKLTFFVTMTCNPKWPEISCKLEPQQHYTDIPMVVCRAFHARLHALKEFIRSYFGSIVYQILVVEC